MKLGLTRHGFTFIELMMVMTIVAIVTGIAIPNLRNTVGEADAVRIVSDARTVQTAILQFAADNPGTLPRRGRRGELPPDLAPYVAMPFAFKTIEYRFIVNRRRGIIRLRVRYPRNDQIGDALRAFRAPGTVVWRRRRTDFYLSI